MESSLSRLLVGLSVQISRSDGELMFFLLEKCPFQIITVCVVEQSSTLTVVC